MMQDHNERSATGPGFGLGPSQRPGVSCRRLLRRQSERELGDREEPCQDLEQQQDERDLQRFAEAPDDAAVS